MGFFSKMLKVGSSAAQDFGEGFNRGMSTGIAAMPDAFNRQREVNRLAREKRAGEARQLLVQGIQRGPMLPRPEFEKRLGGVGGYSGEEIGALWDTQVLNRLNDLKNSARGALDEASSVVVMQSGGTITNTVSNIDDLGNAGIGLKAARRGLDEYLNLVPTLTEPERNTIQAMIGEIDLAQGKIKEATATYVSRMNVQNPLYAEAVQDAAQVYTGHGFKVWQDLAGQYVETEMVSQDTFTMMELSQKLKVVKNLAKLSPNKARNFVTNYGGTNSAQLSNALEGFLLDIKSDVGEEGLINAINSALTQNDFMLASERLDRVPDLPDFKRQEYLETINAESNALILEREKQYDIAVLRVAGDLARQAQSVKNQQRQRPTLSIEQDVTAQEGKGIEMVLASNKYIQDQARKQAGILFPDIVIRRNYQYQMFGDLDIASVVAENELQQLNMGVSKEEIIKRTMANPGLSVTEKVKALEIFEEVGNRIGLDAIISEEADIPMSKTIRKEMGLGDPTADLEEAAYQRWRRLAPSLLYGTGSQRAMTKNELIIYAQTTLTAKEGAKEIPTGSAARIMKRITELVLYGEPELGGEPPEAPSSEISPDWKPVEAGDVELEKQGNAIITRLKQAQLTGKPLNLTAAEEMIMEQYGTRYGFAPQVGRLVQRYLNWRSRQRELFGGPAGSVVSGRVTADSLGVE